MYLPLSEFFIAWVITLFLTCELDNIEIIVNEINDKTVINLYIFLKSKQNTSNINEIKCKIIAVRSAVINMVKLTNNVIVNIHHNCPPCRGTKCGSYCGNGNIVLELAGGTCENLGIEAGDSVNYIF